MKAAAKTEEMASGKAHAAAVREMFAGIAPKYDLLNHVLSINIDKRWRRLVRRKLETILADEKAVVLDVACGTGELSLELKGGAKASVIGTDFCRPMLAIAKKKSASAASEIPFVEGDAMRLPFPDDTFDAVTIAFGLRNLADWEAGLVELRRIVKPVGRVIVLEFSSPSASGLRSLFDFYFTKILPRIGGAVSGLRGAYEYLPDSVSRFPDQKGLVALMTKTGFGSVEYSNLSGGIAAIHSGTKT